MRGFVTIGLRNLVQPKRGSGRGATLARWGLLIIAIPALPACITAKSVSLKVDPRFLPPSPIQVPLTVGVYHSPEFSHYEHSALLTEQMLIFPVGKASVELLEGLYPTLFARTVKLTRRAPLPTGAPPIAAVLETNIDTFAIKARPFVGNRTLCWAEIIYRFNVYTPGGQQLFSWRVRGVGERSGLQHQSGLFTEAVELAMRDAAERFQTSFFDVPEARRWIRGLPAKNVNVGHDKQVELNEQQTVWGVFQDVVAASVKIGRDPRAPGVLSAEVKVRNDANRRLFVRPWDFTLGFQGGQIARVTTATALASSATPHNTRVPPLGYGPAYAFAGPAGFAVGNLISIFINLAAMDAENRRLNEAFAEYRTEAFRNVTLWPGESAEFVVHFLTNPDLWRPDELTVPVVDLDTATRYTVRLRVR